jgi:hypothetical protein
MKYAIVSKAEEAHAKVIESIKNREPEGYDAHKIGRPTLQMEVELVKKLQYYYVNNIGVEATASMSGIAIVTVSKYFRIWYDEAMSLQSRDFAEQQKEAKERSMQAIDFQLARLLKIQAEIETEIEMWRKLHKVDQKTGVEPTPPAITSKFRLRKEIATDISMLQDMKAAVAMAPTVDDDIEGRIKVLLRQKEVIDDGIHIQTEASHVGSSEGDGQGVEQSRSEPEPE